MQLKMLFRSIRSSLGRYLAIMAIIALGVGFFSGLSVCKSAMLQTCNTYIEQQNMYDYRLLSTLGFSRDSAEAFLEIPGVETAEGGVSCDFLCDLDDNEVVLQAHSLSQTINTPYLAAGRMPQNANECLADSLRFTEDDLGKTITVSERNDEDTLSQFTVREFTIVGLASSALYLNFERGTTSLGNGTITGFLFLPREAFQTDYDTEIYLSLQADGMIYSDAYDQELDAVRAQVEATLDEVADARYQTLLDEANAEIAEKQTELDEARADYEQARADTEQELTDADLQLQQAREQLDEARAQLDEGYAQLEQLQAAADQHTQYQTMLDTLTQELTDGEAEYAQNLALYEENQAAYEQSAAQLQQAEQQLSEAKAQLDASAQTLSQSRAELDAGYTQLQQLQAAGNSEQAQQLAAQLQQGEAEYEAGLALYEQSRSEYEASYAAFQTQKEQTQPQLDEAEAQLQAAAEQLSEARAQLDEGQVQLEQLQQAVTQTAQAAELAQSLPQELADGEAQYEENLALYEENLANYESGQEEAETSFAEAEQELADGQTQLDEARQEIDTLEAPVTFALDRSANVGYVCYESDTDIIQGISRVFPLFFFLLAALICITTMTRMVDDERTQIGLLKALGYSSGSIAVKYLVYASSASLIGCIVGFFLGSYAIPRVIWLTYNIMYTFPGQIEFVLDWKTATLSTLAYLICALLATWSSCRSTLRSAAAELIRPASPKSGKRILLERIGFLWKHMKFLHKVSARNIFRYKKRFFMMILGIGGCTALLLTGYGLRDSIQDLVPIQYSQITQYDFSVTLSQSADETVQQDIRDRAGDALQDIIFLSSSTADVIGQSVTKSANLIVADAAISNFNHFELDGASVPYPAEGEALIDQDLAELLGVRPGDTITIRDTDLNEMTLRVSGTYENYISHYVFITPQTYQAQLGEEAEYQTAYLTLKEDADVYSVAASVSNSSYATAVTVNADMKARIDNMLSSLDYVVVLLIVCAGALALIVLYNLTNINIIERVREIATIKVLGFTPFETSSYVFRENVFLTAFGALIGLPLGWLLLQYVISKIKIDTVTFIVQIRPVSYLISLAWTFLFALLVNFVMYFRLQRISMAESLKSIE